jgi:superfamily II DNA or RNA helicase
MLDVIITGTLDVPIETSSKFDTYQWTYKKPANGGYEFVSSILISKDRKTLSFPRNFKKFRETYSGNPKKLNFIDKRVLNKFSSPYKLAKDFKLRPHQEEALKKIEKTLKSSEENAVILKASPGWGKTFVLPAILDILKQKTLIVVDRTDLVSQMYEEIKSNTEKASISILSSKNTEIKDINIATFQFLVKNESLLKELSKVIGLSVTDECHTISIGAFTKVVNIIPSKYRIGLSATPTRSDGLTGALYDVMSTNLVDVPEKNKLKVNYLCLSMGTRVSLKTARTPSKAWEKFYSRKDVLFHPALMAKKMLSFGRAPMIYATYVGAQEELKETLRIMGISSEIINQTVKSKDRKEILDKFQKREIEVLIAGTIMQKGISVHRLDTILNVANHTKESLEQLIGRLRRKNPLKREPLFIDFQYGGKGGRKASLRNGVMSKIASEEKEKVSHWGLEKLENFLKET